MNFSNLIGSITSFILGFWIVYICIDFYHYNDRIQQVGHTEATAHITCYSGRQVIYNAFIKNLTYAENRYKFIQESTGKRITVNGNCVVEE